MIALENLIQVKHLIDGLGKYNDLFGDLIMKRTDFTLQSNFVV